MGSCDYEAVSALVDGELDEKECDALLEHLNSCSDCCRLFERFHAARTLFQGEADLAVPEDFPERVTAALPDQGPVGAPDNDAPTPQRHGFGASRRGWLAAAAGVAALAITGGLLWSGGGPGGSVSESRMASSPGKAGPPAGTSASEAPQAVSADSESDYADLRRYLREHSRFVPAGNDAGFQRVGMEVGQR